MKGREIPRIYTPPLRELDETTSLGFAFERFCSDVLDFKLLPWQRWLAIHALELDESGAFRFRTVIVLISRQNGKSEFGKALAAFFLYVLETPLIVGTAQSLETAEEVWDGTVDMVESIPILAEQVEKVSRRNGGKALKLVGGERYKIAAATRKGGRGLSSDLVLMDELREQTNWDAWGAITKTTMARPNALIWCMSNAGDAQSVVLRHLRRQAHRALGDPDGICSDLETIPDVDELEDDSLGIFEWSASPDCALNDVEQWAQANPSLGYGFMTERALSSALKTDPESVFRTECLCQWIEATIESPFPEGAWEAGQDETSEIPLTEQLFFGIDMSENRTTTSIAVCGQRLDGCWHVEVVAHRVGFAWAVDWLAKQAAKGGATIALQGRGAPISSYLSELQTIEGLEVTACEGRDVGAWCGRFYDAVMASAPEADSDAVPVYHRPQPILDGAAQIAQKKSLGDGAWGWDRKKSVDDVSPLIACSMAFGLATGGRTEPAFYSSAYADEGHSLIVV